uniref:complement subcomponent C1r n=1 Tax=Leptobrachium leishanense TaxID=445787 RepID=A0A8C5PPA3_9ANUR
MYRWLFLLFGIATCSPSRKPLYGVLTTPNYPNTYPNDNHTTWDIEVPEGYQISLNFLVFDLEPSANCHYDFVKVFADKKELGMFCGPPSFKHHPGQQRFVSQENQMKIEFKSDFSNEEDGSIMTYRGFQAYYHALDRNECAQPDDISVTWTPPCQHVCHNYVGGYFCSCFRGYQLQSDKRTCRAECSSEMFTEESGFIYSPGYPQPYPPDLHCNYSIRLEKGLIITINFQGIFEIDDHPRAHCPYDSLKILAGEKIVDSFCGRRSPGTLKTGSNSIDILFETDESGDSRGWKLWYTSEAIQCPDPVPRDQLTIITPNMKEYRMRDYIVVTCQTGYKLMEGDIEQRGFTMLCQTDGTWHRPMPRCEIVTCKEPTRLNNGKLSYLTSLITPTYLSVIEYSCDTPYYSMVTATGSVCGHQWNPIDEAVPTGRIMGGKAAEIGNFPWQVLLSKNGRSGGAVIGEHWVLTAAHVLWDEDPKGNIEKDPSSINIFLGGVDVDEQIKMGNHEVSDYHLHPDFNYESFDNDIALVRLKSPLVMNLNVSPVCLPEQGNELLYEDRKQGLVSGYGLVNKNKIASALRYVPVPMASRDKCKEYFNKNKNKNKNRKTFFSTNMFCAGFPEAGRGDSCQGDSGGAYVAQKDDGTWVSSGIVSWGIGCNEGYGFYTKVTNYLDWILGYTGKLSA